MISRFITSRWAMLFIFLCYAIGLWNMSVPMTGDQKVYLSIALEMKERGSLLIPFLFNHANFLKPPFQYWATLAGWGLFGFNLFGALIPSVLAVIGCCYWVRRISKDKSYLHALFFAGTLGTLTYGTTAQMEIWIVLFYLAAWGFWLEKRVLTTFVIVGVMSWIKGPLYPVLFVLSIILREFLNGEGLKFIKLKNILALMMGILIGVSWYVLAAQSYRNEILDVFLTRENLGKLQTSQGSPIGLWAAFFFSLLPILLWWGASIFDKGFQSKAKMNRNFWISYFAIPAVFFTFFPYRVNTYLYLLTPLAVWMMSVETPDISKSVHRFFGGLSVFIVICLSFISIRLWMGGFIRGEVTLPLLLTLTLWSFGQIRLDGKLVALTSVLLVSLVRLSAEGLGEWDLGPLRNWAALSSSPVAFYLDHEDIWHEFGLVSTALQIDIRRIESQDELTLFLKTGGRIILTDEMTNLTTNLQCVDWIRLKRRLKFPIKELIQSGLSIQDEKLHRIYHLCERDASFRN